MCRMAWIQHPEQWEPQDLLAQLVYLDRIGGGSGIGVGWIHKETGQPLVEKGVKFAPSDALQLMIEKAGEAKHGFLYHSRIPSVGPKCDELCMPFNVQNSLFCYNGTWTNWMDAYYALLGRGINPPPPSQVSDALIAAMLIEEIGIQYLELVDSGVVLFMTSEGVMLQKTYSGDFAIGVAGENPPILASSLSPQLDWSRKQGFKKVTPYISISDDIPDTYLTAYYDYSYIGKKKKVKVILPKSKKAKGQKRKKNKKTTTFADRIAANAQTYKDKAKREKKQDVKMLPAPKANSTNAGDYAGYITALCVKGNIALKPIEWESINSCDALPFAGVYLIHTDSNEYVGIIPMLAMNGVLLGTPNDVTAGNLVFFIDEHDQTWTRRKEWALPIWVKVNPPAECYNSRHPLFDANIAVIQNDETWGVVTRYINPQGSFYLANKVGVLGLVKYSELYDKKIWTNYLLITEAYQIPDYDVVSILSTDDIPDDKCDNWLWECENCGFVTVGPAGLCLGCNSYKWAPFTKLLPPTVRNNDDIFTKAWRINQYCDPRIVNKDNVKDHRQSLFSCSNCGRVLFGYQFDDVCPTCDVLLFNEYNLISPNSYEERYVKCNKCEYSVALNNYVGVCPSCSTTHFVLETSTALIAVNTTTIGSSIPTPVGIFDVQSS